MRPETEEQVAEAIRAARAPLSVVGGATRLWPGEGQGARLETGALSGVVLYEPAAMTLVARAGTALAEIEALLASEHQMLAFEPDGRDGSTIGGVIAANASGPRRVLSGAARDALIGVRFVTGTGGIVKNGGRVMKNVTGYDLVKLMAGSRGRLGVLTEVSLKTAPKPPVSLTLTVAADAQAAIGAMVAALMKPLDISGAAWIGGRLGLRLEGLPGSVEIRASMLRQLLSAHGGIAEDGGIWREMAGFGGDWRFLCRPTDAPAIIAQLPGAFSIDWGGALILARTPAEWRPGALPREARARRIAGGPVLDLPEPDPVTRRIEDGIRERFDPHRILSGAA